MGCVSATKDVLKTNGALGESIINSSMCSQCLPERENTYTRYDMSDGGEGIAH